MTNTQSSPASLTDPEPRRDTRAKSEVRARSQGVHVRMTPEEFERFSALAARQGTSLPNLMRLATEAALYEEALHVIHD